MNIVILSPHFPANFYNFAARLRDLDANVLGIADAPYSELKPELKAALTEYYQVDDMHNYDQLVRACGWFTHKYGKLDRFESNNEYWLKTDARIRTDFNIPGLKLAEIDKVTLKSEMKKVFQSAGIAVAKGKVVNNLSEALSWAKAIGYPVVLKPDRGVGAANTYRCDNAAQLQILCQTRPISAYILEEFIDGTIYTYDGLTDQDGRIVFDNALQYSEGIMEVVNGTKDVYYYTLRKIPAEHQAIGRTAINAFQIKERFFHFEFFKTAENRLIALEVNMRPPGGLTVDMMNYTNDIDLYQQWANLTVHNQFTAAFSRDYHCCYIGRRWHKTYAHSHHDIMRRYGELIPYHDPMPAVFSEALGDYAYLVRSPELKIIRKVIDFCLKTQ
jgi:biotin carboxylase